jgi:hypothetical protein
MATSVQSILQEYFEQFAQNHPLSLQQRLAAERMRDCRTPALGGHVVGCPEGHVRTICCNSCRHRNCPLCSSFAREKWLAAWKERLLDCPHHHIVFTLPHELNPLWRYSKREFGKMRAFLLKALEQGRLTLPPDKTLTAQNNLLNRLGAKPGTSRSWTATHTASGWRPTRPII